MKPRLLVLALALAALSAGAAPPPGMPASDWIKRTRERIARLLGPQHDKSPAPDHVANPFREPGRVEVEQPAKTGVAPASDDEMLARLAAMLKVSGLVRVGDVPQVIINQLLYKEGDLVAVRSAGDVTYLRVGRISSSELVLELNKATRTVHLK